MQIAAGMAALIANCRKINAGTCMGGAPPAIDALSTPAVRETPKCTETWGFGGCEAKSAGTIAAYKALAAEEDVGFVDL